MENKPSLFFSLTVSLSLSSINWSGGKSRGGNGKLWNLCGLPCIWLWKLSNAAKERCMRCRLIIVRSLWFVIVLSWTRTSVHSSANSSMKFDDARNWNESCVCFCISQFLCCCCSFVRRLHQSLLVAWVVGGLAVQNLTYDSAVMSSNPGHQAVE